jgi:hypothetical protein
VFCALGFNFLSPKKVSFDTKMLRVRSALLRPLNMLRMPNGLQIDRRPSNSMASARPFTPSTMEELALDEFSTNMLKKPSLNPLHENEHSVNVPAPTKRQLRLYMLNRAVPMIGFGFMDNIIMIQAGDLIDNSIGVTLGLSTLTAAAIGQICSDFSGVCFGGGIEALAMRLGLPHSGLSREQRRLRRVKLFGVAAAAIGVVLGCCLGMTSLLFMDLDKSERSKRQRQLQLIFNGIVKEGRENLQADNLILWLMEEDGIHAWTVASSFSSASPSDQLLKQAFESFDANGSGMIRSSDVIKTFDRLGLVFNPDTLLPRLQSARELHANSALSFEEFKLLLLSLVTSDEARVKIHPGTLRHSVIQNSSIVNVHNPQTSSHAAEIDQLDRYFASKTRNMLIGAIVHPKTQRVLGCIEATNKTPTSTSSSSSSSPSSSDQALSASTGFTEHDERLLKVMCTHAALFIDQSE